MIRWPADSVTLLVDGRLLITGSRFERLTAQPFEAWRPWGVIVSPAPEPSITAVEPPPNRMAAAVALTDGRVLFAGGWPWDRNASQEPARDLAIFR